MLLEINELTFIYNAGTTYEKKALDNVSLSVDKGEFIGIIGHTGSGKSTLIQHFNALLTPSFGQVFFDKEPVGKNKEQLPVIRQKVGLVFQYPEHQLFEISVFKDIAFGLKNLNLSEKELTVRVEEALNNVGLQASTANKSPFELSGGERRRVAIAGVLVTKPSVLVLDEPAAGLDPKGRHEILAMLKKMHTDAKGELTIILVSHAMEDIARYCERIYVMQSGRIALSGTPREVFRNGDALLEMGLDLPQMTQLIRALNKKGFSLDEGIFTVQEAYTAIKDSLRSK